MRSVQQMSWMTYVKPVDSARVPQPGQAVQDLILGGARCLGRFRLFDPLPCGSCLRAKLIDTDS